MNFIKVSDTDTAEKLIKLGFQQISKDGNMYTFLNNGKQLFEDDKNIVYTNNICM